MGVREEIWTHSKFSQYVGSSSDSHSDHTADPAESIVQRFTPGVKTEA